MTRTTALALAALMALTLGSAPADAAPGDMDYRAGLGCCGS